MSLAAVAWLARVAATRQVEVRAVVRARLELLVEVVSMADPAGIVRMTASRVVSVGFHGVSTITQRRVTRFRM